MDIQGVLVLALAAAAAAFLAWRVLGPLFRGPTSSACHGCSASCEPKAAAKRSACGTPASAPRAHVVTLIRPKRPS